MTDTLKKVLRIFAASPSDVASERAKLETVVASLKPMADYLGLTLEVVDWRAVVPDAGRAQQIIFDQLKPTSWDIFVGILWHRFGTPPGGKDPQTQKDYLSGTEEEFRTAYRLHKQFDKPRIVMYRCTRAIPLDADFAQAQRVKDFFKEIQDPQSEFRVLTQSFDTLEAFGNLWLDNLQKLLAEYGEQSKTPITPEIAQIFAPKIPVNLPRRQSFFGRRDEINKVLGALSSAERGWGVVIDGIGGIGKTALAVEAAYRCKELEVFDAFVFVSAKKNRLDPSGITELSAISNLDEFVNETARVLGNPGIAQLVGEGKRRALLDTLHSTRALLIYDNLETLSEGEQKELADWLRFLPQNCKAILTSRRRGGEGALWLRLEKLDWTAARDIIADEAKKDGRLAQKLEKAGEARWQELYDETKGSPLALVHVLGLIRTRATLSFDGALELLRGNRDPDLQRFIFLEARKGLGATDLSVLRALSFFVPAAPFDALIQVAELSRNALEMSLDRLDALSLLDKLEGTERFALHPLTRAFVRDGLFADAKIARETGVRFARYWAEYAERFGEYFSYGTYARLETEWPNLDAATSLLWIIAGVQFPSEKEIQREEELRRMVNRPLTVRHQWIKDREAAKTFSDLVFALRQFLSFSGRWDERIALNTRAYQAAFLLNEWSVAGWHAYDVARIQNNRANTAEAAFWTNKCQEVWELGGNAGNRATALRLRGLIAQQKKEFAEAERLWKDALTILRALNFDEDVGITLNSLGEIAHEQKQYDAAEQYYLEALQLARKIGSKKGETIYGGNMAELALDRKRFSEARALCEQALGLARKISLTDMVAMNQCRLARVHEAEERADLALPLAQDALKIYERLQHRNLAAARELVERLQERMPDEGGRMQR